MRRLAPTKPSRAKSSSRPAGDGSTRAARSPQARLMRSRATSAELVEASEQALASPP